MSERRSTTALFLVLLMLTSVVGHATANEAQSDVEETVTEIGTVYGDLNEFDVAEGSQYLLINESQPVVSATSFIKQAWIEEGRPGVDDIRYQPTMARSTCTQHVVGDTLLYRFQEEQRTSTSQKQLQLLPFWSNREERFLRLFCKTSHRHGIKRFILR